MKRIIAVTGSFDDNIKSIIRLVDLQNLCINCSEENVELIFESCSFIHASLMVIIGTLPKIGQLLGKNITLNFYNSPILRYMQNSGLARYYNKDAQPNENAIPFRHIEDLVNAADQIDMILYKAPVVLNPDAADILSSRLYEVFSNSFEHSLSELDTFCCGHWMPKKRYLTFSIYDAGIGIPQNIRKYLDKKVSDVDCLRLALTDGFSTAENQVGFTRGLGLSDLKSFVELNSGKMKLCSGNGCYILDGDDERFYSLNTSICGTLFTMNIVADNDHIYIV